MLRPLLFTPRKDTQPKRQPSLSSILVLAKALEIPASKMVQLVEKKMKL
jgi:hypothetical protein